MPRQLTDVELDREVLFVLRMHKGQQNAIRRWDLCKQVFGQDAALNRSADNTYDRNVRSSIERLRWDGHIICNMGNGDGYFLADTKEEYQAFRNMYSSRAYRVIEVVNKMDKSAAEKWPNPLQPSLM